MAHHCDSPPANERITIMSDDSLLGSIHYMKGQAGPIYLIISADGITVIDAGFPSDAGRIIKYVEGDLGRDADDIKLIILTHSHFDHVNGVDSLVQRTNARVAAHESAKKYLTGQEALPVTSPASYLGFLLFLIKNKFPRPSVADVFSMPCAGIPGLKKGIKSRVDVWLKEGKAVPGMPGWEVIHTQGHTDDGICLYNYQEKILFSGDTIINDKGVLRLNRLLVWNEAALRNSFKKLRQFPVDNLFPGWGIPVAKNDVLKDIE
jgi:glyoxylase-like metal-dependent hydrolase (beta-lactamase superfamily II)